VFALKLNRGKLAENLIGSIRRKYSIDGAFPQIASHDRMYHFETISASPGNPAFTIWIESALAYFANSLLTRALCRRGWRALVFA
jgi:hypothetical protein